MTDVMISGPDGAPIAESVPGLRRQAGLSGSQAMMKQSLGLGEPVGIQLVVARELDGNVQEEDS